MGYTLAAYSPVCRRMFAQPRLQGIDKKSLPREGLMLFFCCVLCCFVVCFCVVVVFCCFVCPLEDDHMKRSRSEESYDEE